MECAKNISLAAFSGEREARSSLTVLPAVDAMRSASALDGRIPKRRLTTHVRSGNFAAPTRRHQSRGLALDTSLSRLHLPVQREEQLHLDVRGQGCVTSFFAELT